MTTFIAFPEIFNSQIDNFDNASQTLDYAYSEEEATELENKYKAKGYTISGRKVEDDEIFILGRAPRFKMSNISVYNGNPLVITEGKVIFQANVIEAEWTDGGESSEWFLLERESVNVITPA